MPNGLTFVKCRRSGLTACYVTATGRKAHGDLPIRTLQDVEHAEKRAGLQDYNRRGSMGL